MVICQLFFITHNPALINFSLEGVNQPGNYFLADSFLDTFDRETNPYKSII